jgi:hypothetical protein
LRRRHQPSCAISGTARWHPLVTGQSPHRAYIGFGHRAMP